MQTFPPTMRAMACISRQGLNLLVEKYTLSAIDFKNLTNKNQLIELQRLKKEDQIDIWVRS